MATVPEIAGPVSPTSPKPVYADPASDTAAFGGAQAKALSAAGPELQRVSDAIGTATEAAQRQKAAVAYSNAVNAFNADPTVNPALAMPKGAGQVNGQNLTDIGTDANGTGGVIANYTDNSQSKANSAADAFGNQFGPAWGDRLASALQSIHNDNVTTITQAARGAQNNQVNAQFKSDMQPILAQAGSANPPPLTDLAAQVADKAAIVSSGTSAAAGTVAHNDGMNAMLAAVFQGQITRAQTSQDLDAVRANLAAAQPLFIESNGAAMATALYQDIAGKQYKLVEALKNTPYSPTGDQQVAINNMAALAHPNTMTPSQLDNTLFALDRLSKPTLDAVTHLPTQPGMDVTNLSGYAAADAGFYAAYGRHLPGYNAARPTDGVQPSYGGPGAPTAAPAPGPAPAPAPVNPAPAPGPAAAAVPVNPAPAPGPAAASSQADYDPMAPHGDGGKPTIWDYNERGQLTGSLSAAERLGHGTEGAGGAVPGGATAAHDAAQNFILQASQALAPTNVAGSDRPPMSGMEKNAEKVLNKLLPEPWESQANMRTNILAVDDMLDTAFKQAQKSGADTSLSPAAQQQARIRASTLNALRASLGAPLRLEEARAKNANPARNTPYRKADDTIGYAVGSRR